MRKAAELVYPSILALILIISGATTTRAQNREKFVISAKAGGVNAVTGRTGVHAKGSSEWEQLTIKDNLEGGDVVKTGLDGRVEILLNPGSYMRVAENSEFELTSNSLENLEVRLIRGTAIVEATGADDTELLINITTPHAKMAIVQRGLYRVNVVPGDLTELIVRKGRVLLADPQTKVKGGRKLIFSGNTFSIAKLQDADKKSVDSFDSWSKQRAETVAQANRKMASRALNSFVSGFSDDWTRSLSAGRSGVWIFNPRFGFFTFLPFYMGWGSPYGGSYSNVFYTGYAWDRSWPNDGFRTPGHSFPPPSGRGGPTGIREPTVSSPTPMAKPTMSGSPNGGHRVGKVDQS